MAQNRGLSSSSELNVEQTPMINGYKMLKDTPQIERNEDSFITNRFNKFKLPGTPSREELGHKIANETQMRKRDQKAKEKQNHYSKIGLKMRAQDSEGNLTADAAFGRLKSPLSIKSNSVKSMMTPGSVHSFKSAALS